MTKFTQQAVEAINRKRIPVGGWRIASLEVGGKGKIIENFGFRISNYAYVFSSAYCRYQGSIYAFANHRDTESTEGTIFFARSGDPPASPERERWRAGGDRANRGPALPKQQDLA